MHAVIFDLDGTLLNTIGDIAAAMNTVLQTHGMPTAPAEAYTSRVGWGLTDLVRRSVPADCAQDDERITQMAEELRTYYAAHPVVYTHPYSGILQLIYSLQQKNIRMGVLSNKADSLVQHIVRAVFGDGVFHMVQGAVDSIPRKPNPAGCRQLLEHLDAAADTPFVGDSEIDITTAQNAGCRPVGVAWGFRTAKQIQNAGAEIICYTTNDLRNYLFHIFNIQGKIS